MMDEKEIFKKQWLDFCRYVKDFATMDSYTNNQEYNYGRYEIMHNWIIDLFNPGRINEGFKC